LSSSAARVKLSLRAAASKALMAFRGGKRRNMPAFVRKTHERIEEACSADKIEDGRDNGISTDLVGRVPIPRATRIEFQRPYHRSSESRATSFFAPGLHCAVQSL
jgi:hypothetical protein